jgi:hypothetical protein
MLVQPDELEGEADAEVNRIMEEITAGILAPAGSAPTTAPPTAMAAPAEVRTQHHCSHTGTFIATISFYLL